MSSSEATIWQYRPLWLLIGWLWIVAIWYLSLAADLLSLDLGVSFTDKILHAGSYGLLMAWFLQLYHRRDSRITCMIAFIGMGVLLEYLQGMTSYRKYEVADMLANMTGVLLAWFFVRGKVSNILLQFEQYFKRGV